ncbi:MAG: L-serine ammonia-lyase, iron-sulfur-dependent, subunit alpha [Burkholderiaceae bacterium]
MRQLNIGDSLDGRIGESPGSGWRWPSLVGATRRSAPTAFRRDEGDTPAQAENAAEIGVEHHLGLTCDPVGVRCGSPAPNAMRSPRSRPPTPRGDATHHVSLDKVVKTRRDTGADMMTKYNETARDGLVANIVEC